MFDAIETVDRAPSACFRFDWYLDFIIVNAEKTTPHKYYQMVEVGSEPWQKLLEILT